jgi:rare lipoprotein A
MRHLKPLLFITALISSGVPSVYATTAQSGHKRHHSAHKTKKTHKIAPKHATNGYRHHHIHHKIKKNNYMEGTASFYGDNDGFDGKTMADGHTFDTNDVYAAAHPTLPLGTKLLVTNLANGRSLCVEVTDRMPRTTHRVIDLSKAAAMYLGMYHRGLTQVSLVKLTNAEYQKRKKYLEVDSTDNGQPG